MKPAPLLSLSVLAVAAGCYSYSEPPLPTNTRPVTPHSRQLATSGLDVPLTTPGAYQRSGMSGTTSDVDDEAETLFAMQELAWGDPGLGSSRPQADLDAPNELRNATPRGAVFRPSDHYFINGVDTGPSTDAMPGTGGPGKLKLRKAAEAAELKAAEE